MSEHENEFLKELKKTIANYLIGFAFLMFSSGIIFYFSTTYRLQTLEKQGERLEQDKADKSVMQSELNSVNKTLLRIETKLDSKK